MYTNRRTWDDGDTDIPPVATCLAIHGGEQRMFFVTNLLITDDENSDSVCGTTPEALYSEGRKRREFRYVKQQNLGKLC